MEELKIDGIPIEDYGTPNSRSVYCGEINECFELEKIGQTIKSNIDFWKEKYFELEKNNIPISFIEKKKEEIKNKDLEIYDTDSEDIIIAKYEDRAILDFCNELLDERSNTDD